MTARITCRGCGEKRVCQWLKVGKLVEIALCWECRHAGLVPYA